MKSMKCLMWSPLFATALVCAMTLGAAAADGPPPALFAGAATTEGGGGAVYLFVAGPSAAAEAVPESLRLLSRQLRLRRPLRPYLPDLFLLAGGGGLLSRRRGLLRRRRQLALRDVAVGVSVLVRRGNASSAFLSLRSLQSANP
jgi:hypothetical protein